MRTEALNVVQQFVIESGLIHLADVELRIINAEDPFDCRYVLFEDPIQLLNAARLEASPVAAGFSLVA